MKILITGATGMLGTSLVHCFLKKGSDVHGLSRGKMRRDLFPKEHLSELDITDEERIKALIQSLRPDVMVHSAALSDVDYCEKFPDEAHRVNAEGTRFLVEAAEQGGAVFCYVSTDYVFDGESMTPYHEEDRCNPLNSYGMSKFLGEEYTRAACKRHFVVRTSWLFGENRDSFVHHVLERSQTEKRMKLVEDKWSTPTYTPDLAYSIYALFEKNAPWGTYHITNGGGGCSWLEYGRSVLTYSGISGISLEPIPLKALALAARRPLRTVLSSDKFCRATRSTLRSWEEALQEYVAALNPAPSKK